MAVTLLPDEVTTQVTLEGAITIAGASELKETLLRAIEAGKDVSVSLGGVTALDVTAVEVLWAASRAAKASGLRFSLSVPLGEELSTSLREAGIDLSDLWERAV
jgi:anti-anti-sigma regulatory factor